jgi:hypothetical protein
MTSAPIRDLLGRHPVTPENAAFLFMNHRAAQLAKVRAMDHTLLLKNAVSTVKTIKTIKTFGILVMHSTVNVSGSGSPRCAILRRFTASK